MSYRRIAFLALFLFCGFAFAQPLADRVPSDAVVYIGWQGMDSLGTGYEKSHLKGVIDSSNIPQFFSEFLPRLIYCTVGDVGKPHAYSPVKADPLSRKDAAAARQISGKRVGSLIIASRH